ncbi:MAG: hypothetical protein ACR2GY_08070 [Phycisphaerales bacterium]
MSDYIPIEDAAFRDWATNFRDRVQADPALYGFVAADGDSIGVVVDDFVAKYDIAEAPITRTKQTVADKSAARATAESLLRQYSIDVKYNAGVTDGDKINLGVRPVNTNRQPIEVPQTSPLLNVLGATPGSHTVVYADTTTPDSKKKPFGASELQLFMAVTDADNATLAEAAFYGKFTKNPIGVEFNAGQTQKVATYWARWASVRGETGPWSLPISMTIAA